MKTIVITGASRGIGLATASKFLAEGWRVIGTYHQKPASIEHMNFVQAPLDLASPESIATAAAEIARISPRIDALVNNAAVLLDYDDEAAAAGRIRDTLAVNVVGTVDITERLLPLLGAAGHIVNIDSNLGSFSHDIEENSAVGYRMSKAALNMYTRTLAYRLRSSGILISSLDPGWVDTDMGRAGGGEPDRKPAEPADDIFRLVTTVTDINDSGNFWRFGSRREW
jgi:NAD(P)-dependent dehydrogenase (short-subunit alcohol dehydrogenase family)